MMRSSSERPGPERGEDQEPEPTKFSDAQRVSDDDDVPNREVEEDVPNREVEEDPSRESPASAS